MRQLEIWPGVMAHASGGLWLADTQTLAVADLHLGYGWAQRRRGELGPLADDKIELRLRQLIDELCPRKLLLVGDIVHSPKPCEAERELIERVLGESQQRTDVIAIKGNHDRRFARDFGELQIPLVDNWQEDSIQLTHGDRLPSTVTGRLVIGHLHPAVGLRDAAGARQRVPAFLIAGPVIVMPAFSPFAAGLDVWNSMPAEVSALGGVEAEVIAATGARAVNLGPLSRLVSPARGSRPKDFWRSK